MDNSFKYQALSGLDGSVSPTLARASVSALVERLLSLLLPEVFSPCTHPSLTPDDPLLLLVGLLDDSFAFVGKKGDVEGLARGFFAALPDVRRLLLLDADAMYDGDPAATSPREVMLCYPGFYAISTYRMAHILHGLAVPLLPRLFTEHAHSLTGIDIHPAAQIGESFFIDHGTGIVIGETATVGNRVKLYQGVTLGARSFQKDGEGRLIRGTKRHPDIRDGTVIYANATVLGGDTVVGENCVIGEGVRITSSVPAGSIVTRPSDSAARVQNNR